MKVDAKYSQVDIVATMNPHEAFMVIEELNRKRPLGNELQQLYVLLKRKIDEVFQVAITAKVDIWD